MEILKHKTAHASYYDTRAEHYDEFNENNSRGINSLLEKILKEQNASSILDLTCGTGSQVFWLAERGFKVVGSDISHSMLNIAKEKAARKNLEIRFLEADCRMVNAGKFDAAITIFNSIGHLTREDFKLAIQNINSNLNPGGIYIFDIFNLDYLRAGNNITKLTGDWMTISGEKKLRKIQFSTISDDGILASYSTYIDQDANSSPTKISTGYENRLQVYSSSELADMLKESGFSILKQTDITGEKFSQENTERILTIAKKI